MSENTNRPTAHAPAREAASRIERERAAALDRMLASCGFVRSYDVQIDDHGTLTGEVTAPARLIRQSLGPVLDARDVSFELPAHARPRSEVVVTADLVDLRGGR